jgi:hypothetical protein
MIKFDFFAEAFGGKMAGALSVFGLFLRYDRSPSSSSFLANHP